MNGLGELASRNLDAYKLLSIWGKSCLMKHFVFSGIDQITYILEIIVWLTVTVELLNSGPRQSARS